MTPVPPIRRPGRQAPVLVAVLAVLLAAAGVVLLARTDAGLSHRHRTVTGVPLTEIVVAGGAGAQPAAGGQRPGVVVAHGFAGSARLMTPIADRLARAGFTVVLLDFAGHGAHRGRLPGADKDSAAVLAADLDTAVRHLRSLPGVDPARIGLVGHSMGAGAVTRYAVAHPEVAATVAISLPDAGTLPESGDRSGASDLPDGGHLSGAGASAVLPRSLLLLVGGSEFAGFREAADEAVARGGGTADRRAVVVPGVEHISVLFAGRTHGETVAWLTATLGPAAPPGPTPALVGPAARLVAAALLLLGFAVGLYPLAVLALGRAGPPVGRSRRVRRSAALGRSRRVRQSAALGWPLLAVAVALAVAVVAARLLPTDRLPLAVGGYLTAFLATAGLVLTGAVRLVHARLPGTGRTGGARQITAGVAFTGYTALAVAAPLHLGFTSTMPVGHRWWLLPVVVAGCLVFFVGAERVAATVAERVAATVAERAAATVAERAAATTADAAREGTAATVASPAGGAAEGLTGAANLGYAVVCAASVVGLTGAALVGLAPGFVLLVVPLFALLLAWQVAWAAVLRRLGAPRWLVALTGAVLLGWPVATTLPLTG